jgi:hypothetical protein
LLGKGGATEAGWHRIQYALECMKKLQFVLRGVHQPQVQTPDHFGVGIMYHAGRARWFSLRFATDEKAWMKIRDAVREAAASNKLPVSLKAEQDALALISAYIEHYKRLPKPNPIAAEYKLGPTPIIPGDQFSMRTAQLDDVSHYPEVSNWLCIGESKTTSTTVGDVENQYTVHGQTMLQMLLWKNDPNGEKKYGPVKGVMLDVAVKGYSGKPPKFGRVFVQITDYQLNWFARSLRGYLGAAAAVDWNTEAPRNPMSCTRMQGRGRIACEFRDLCKFGKSAAGNFVLEDGSSLLRFKPDEFRRVMPWE